MYNILLGGAAGDGIDTMAALLEKIFKKFGFHVFTTRDCMSRIRGGHNFVKIRFGSTAMNTHREALDGIIAMNEETCIIHQSHLRSEGFILGDSSFDFQDDRAVKLPFQKMAAQLGNPKTSSTIAIGALLKLFHLPTALAATVVAEHLREPLREVNLAALKEGFAAVDFQFPAITLPTLDHMILTGSAAIALGALAADLKFYSAYPMSPSTGILEYLSQHGDSLGIVVEQAEDEIAAINMALGASYAGARSMVGTSGGGFSLMVEALGFAGIAEIPLVIVNAQRPGPATGLPTRTEQSDLRFVISASQGEFPRMVIALRHHEDAFFQTARAIAIAEKYQIPVILLSDQHLSDSSATVPLFDTAKLYAYAADAVVEDIFAEGAAYQRYQLTESGISLRLIPGKTEYPVCVDSDEHDVDGKITESAEVRRQMVDKRMRKLDLLEKELLEPEFFGGERVDTLLVGFGSTYAAIKEAVAVLNADGGSYGALVFGDIYPLPQKLFKNYAKKAGKIINIEQNATGQLAGLLRETTLIACHESILKYDGRPISTDDILHEIRKRQRKEGVSYESS